MLPNDAVPSGLYQLCEEFGRQLREFYPEHDWATVEPILQRIWTQQRRDADWEVARELIRSAWTDGAQSAP